MPWNPEHYNVKTKKKKMEKPKPTQSDDPDYRYGDFRDEIMAAERLKKKQKKDEL